MLPLPGLISLGVWVCVVIVIRLISNANYLAYSFMVMSAIIEMVLIIITVVVTDGLPTSISARLLADVTYPHR